MLVFVVFISPELLFTNFVVGLTSHLLFVHNLNIDLHGAINGSNWSIATENAVLCASNPDCTMDKSWSLVDHSGHFYWYRLGMEIWRYRVGTTVIPPQKSGLQR